MTAPTHTALIAGLRPAERSSQASTRPGTAHDDAVAALRAHAARWSLRDAASSWVAGLWSAPFGWRSALTGVAVGAVLPAHPAEPYSAASDACRVCGHRDGLALDVAEERWQRHTQGAPIDGAVAEHALALDDLAGHPRPDPTEYDVWALRALLTTLRTLPPRTRPSKARDALRRTGVLPTSSPWAYQSVLEELALVGVVATAERPGMVERWTTYAERDQRPSVRVEVQAPLAWWNSDHGLREGVVEQVFGDLGAASVDLDGPRPTPVPERAATATVAIPALLRAPRTGGGLPPHVGTGQAEAGDVYAIRLGDDRWVTAYVHGETLTEPRRYVLVEYLAGVHTSFPSPDAVGVAVQPRRDGGRSTFRVHSLEKLPRARRIARGVPAPAAAEPLPASSPTGAAEHLRQMAGWFFPDP